MPHCCCCSTESELVGQTSIGLQDIISACADRGQESQGWYDVFGKSGRSHGRVQLGLKWSSISSSAAQVTPNMVQRQLQSPSSTSPSLSSSLQGRLQHKRQQYTTAYPPDFAGWFYVDPCGEQQGPFTLEQMRNWLSHFDPTMLVCQPGQSQWVELRTVSALHGPPSGRVPGHSTEPADPLLPAAPPPPVDLPPPAFPPPQQLSLPSVRSSMFLVRCPDGLSAGQQFYLSSGDSAELLVQVPPGVSGGQSFHVELPAPRPGESWKPVQSKTKQQNKHKTPSEPKKVKQQDLDFDNGASIQTTSATVGLGAMLLSSW